MRTYEKTHGWLKFILDVSNIKYTTWLLIGEAVSKVEHIAGVPLAPEYIAEKLHWPLDRVNVTLEDLERRMTFLYRDSEGAVAWAYPVTADETPHHVTFDTGERINAA